MQHVTSQVETDVVRSRRQANLLKQVRQMHLYLGTFFAPSILFFALTGAIQVVGLHEGRPGSTYKPPVWIEKLAQVHKKQTLVTRREGPPARPRDREPVERRPGPEQGGPPKESGSSVPMKAFTLLMSVGLALTTCLGIYMSFKYNRSRRLVWSLLVTGTLLPICLLML